MHPRLIAQHQVVQDAEVAAQGQVLINGFDTESTNSTGVAAWDGPPLELNVAAIRRNETSDHLDDRGFACAIITNQAQHLSFVNVERDVFYRPHLAVATTNTFNAEHERARLAMEACVGAMTQPLQRDRLMPATRTQLPDVYESDSRVAPD